MIVESFQQKIFFVDNPFLIKDRKKILNKII
jgi:hypothetical protein